MPIKLCLPSRARSILPVVTSALLFTGCATSPATASAERSDPLEQVNRKVFAFNEGVDRTVLKPLATAYKEVVPPLIQTGASNFFSNLRMPWSSVNLMLQGRMSDGLTVAARFGVNTTVGLLGLVDVATNWGLPQRSEDFGLTLDSWSIGAGPYLVLPVLGPSSLRDVLSLPVDSVGNPLGQINSVSVSNSLVAAQMVSKRADLLGWGDLLDQVALDKYAMVRDAHLKRRNRSSPKTAADAEPATEIHRKTSE